MTELSPLIQASSDEVELALLRSTERDEPSAHALAKTAAAMGLGASLTTAALDAAAADAGGSVLASAGSSSIWISALKAVFVGAISGTLAATAAHALLSEPSADHVTDTRPATAPLPIARQKAAVAALPSAQLPKREPASDQTTAGVNPGDTRTLTPDPTPPVTATSRGEAEPPPPPLATTLAGSPATPYPHGNTVASPSSAHAAFQPLPATTATRPAGSVAAPGTALARPAPQASAPAASVSIADELAAIESARQALSAGRARDALAALQRYQARWPGGVFSAEALVLRVQAKIQLGDRASAVREANALINAQPNSRHASRLRALLGTSTSK
jgi:hypothetical protein